MIYRKLDVNGDLTFGHGLKDYHSQNIEAVAQSIKTRLGLWLGEWYLDSSEGVPYKQDILKKYGKDKALRLIQECILNTKGVLNISAFFYVYDENTRRLSMDITVNTIYGEAQINVNK